MDCNRDSECNHQWNTVRKGQYPRPENESHIKKICIECGEVGYYNIEDTSSGFGYPYDTPYTKEDYETFIKENF